MCGEQTAEVTDVWQTTVSETLHLMLPSWTFYVSQHTFLGTGQISRPRLCTTGK